MRPDPFGLAALRESTRTAWQSSPTRLTEDTATEHDLAAIGYRDRLPVELAANAADAAAAAHRDGRLSVELHDERTLVVANTGAGLSAEGVASLLAVRVSAKAHSHEATVVGRFGVGFSAVAAVADRVEIRSVSGSIVFDRARSARCAGADDAPLLRMAWPTDAPPPDGYDTAVVMSLRTDVDGPALLAAFSASVADLLLELPALQQISVAGRVTRRRRVALADGLDELILSSGGSTRHWLQAGAEANGAAGTRWLVETVDGVPRPYRTDVLRAPTETDIELSLPARCIAAVEVTPDRRRLYPGADISGAAAGYVELVRAIEPRYRAAMVPPAGFARSDVDDVLRARVLGRLRAERWLPAAGPFGDAGDDSDVAGGRALVFPDLSTELADLLGPVLADLIAPELSERTTLAALRSVGATELSLADLAGRLASVQRSAAWWYQLYDALSPYVSSYEVEELGALPVPRADGRLNIGARGLYLPAGGVGRVGWLPTVAADAAHPLLERLGAQPVSVSELLGSDALRGLVESFDDADLDDTETIDAATELAGDVLRLIAADTTVAVPKWLSAVPIADDAGELARADELLLPDSPLAAVLVDDSPFGMVDDALIADWGTDVLRRVGVGWGFTLVHDDLPTGADHELPDEEQWWDDLAEPPAELWAVRDLDLVADDRWSRALTLLAADPDLAVAIVDPAGYTCWWLRSFARIDGRPLACWRAPGDPTLQGVLDPLDHLAADVFAGALGGVPVRSPATADAIVEGLADPRRTVSSGVAVAAYSALAQAISTGAVDADDVGSLLDPVALRAVGGGIVGERALVVDQPWLMQVVDPSVAIVVSVPIDETSAEIIADAFDVRLASEGLHVDIAEPGAGSSWASSVAALTFAAQRGGPLPHGEVRLHDRLVVTVTADGIARDVDVAWWIDDRGVTHLGRFTMMS